MATIVLDDVWLITLEGGEDGAEKGDVQLGASGEESLDSSS